MSRSTSKRTVALLCIAGLAFGACTDTVDADFAGPGSAVTESSTTTAADDQDADNTDAADSIDSPESGDSAADTDDRSEPAADVETTQDGTDGSADEPEEPTLAMVEEEAISEAPAPEPPAEEPPELSDDGSVDVPQADLGPGESVLCGTVQIGIDAVNDGATAKAEDQRTRILDGVDSIADQPLADLLSTVADSSTLDAALLTDALNRCEELGYQS